MGMFGGRGPNDEGKRHFYKVSEIGDRNANTGGFNLFSVGGIVSSKELLKRF